jgi:transposase-like protein
MKRRRQFTSEQKVQILREHLENQIRISDIAEKYGIHPTVLARWKKELFENALDTFSGKHKKRNGKTRKEEQLEQKVTRMQEVITELSTEVVDLRKKYHGGA